MCAISSNNQSYFKLRQEALQNITSMLTFDDLAKWKCVSRGTQRLLLLEEFRRVKTVGLDQITVDADQLFAYSKAMRLPPLDFSALWKEIRFPVRFSKTKAIAITSLADRSSRHNHLPYSILIKTLALLPFQDLETYAKTNKRTWTAYKGEDPNMQSFFPEIHRSQVLQLTQLDFKKMHEYFAALDLSDGQWEQFFVSCRNVRDVFFNILGPTDVDITIDDQVLTAVGNHCRNLRSLTLIGCGEGTTYPAFAHLMERSPDVTSLRLMSVQWMNDTAVQKIVEHYPNLTTFDLGLHSHSITDVALNALSTCPNLTKVGLGCSRNVTLEGFKNLLRNCPIEEIDMGDFKSDEWTHTLLEMRPKVHTYVGAPAINGLQRLLISPSIEHIRMSPSSIPLHSPPLESIPERRCSIQMATSMHASHVQQLLSPHPHIRVTLRNNNDHTYEPHISA